MATFTAPWTEIPHYFQQSLWDWIDADLIGRSYNSDRFLRVDLLRRAERKLHAELPSLEEYHVDSGPDALRKHYKKVGPAALLTFVDFLMSDLPEDHSLLEALEERLIESGSGWRVGTRAGKPGLVQRLPHGVVDAAEATVHHGRAGKRLAEAWEAAFGMNPNPSEAYRFAVKAVEDASAPVVIPNDPSPTLGKVNQRIEQGGKFRLPHLREEPGGTTSHDVLLYNLKQLWWGQYDRHGGLQASPLPDDVTQEEAETAVLLAVTLVGWFETGKVQP
ncbi:hypothetical protein I548_4410 [Mycobacterium intracellulare]|nr:hypothetical protein I548_4410 [Mycobacterium intracellulare]